jgi:signal transduction histidine kinase
MVEHVTKQLPSSKVQFLRRHNVTDLFACTCTLGLAGALGWRLRRQGQALRVAQGQIAVLRRATASLVGAAHLDPFLREILAAIAEQLGATWVVLFLYDRTEESVYPHLVYRDRQVLTAEQAMPEASQHLSAHDVPIWHELARVRRPLLLNDIAHDQRLVHRQSLHAAGVANLLLIPLILGHDALGWFSINATEPRRYTSAELDIAQALAQQAALAVTLTRMAAQSRQTAMLEERNRMAREIHDVLAQGLTGIVLQLEGVESALVAPSRIETALQRLERARGLARQTLAEARRSLWTLRTPRLEQKDLFTALRDSVEALVAETSLAVTVEAEGVCPLLPPELAQDMLRIAQEAVTNVVKHAQARTLAVQLRCAPSLLELRVHDDGRGFAVDVQQPGIERGFGLIMMRERAARHGGTLAIISQPGQGCAVLARISIAPQAVGIDVRG